MSAPATELLPVIPAAGARFPAVVPVLCGIVIAASWFAGCLVLVLPF